MDREGSILCKSRAAPRFRGDGCRRAHCHRHRPAARVLETAFQPAAAAPREFHRASSGRSRADTQCWLRWATARWEFGEMHTYPAAPACERRWLDTRWAAEPFQYGPTHPCWRPWRARRSGWAAATQALVRDPTLSREQAETGQCNAAGR